MVYHIGVSFASCIVLCMSSSGRVFFVYKKWSVKCSMICHHLLPKSPHTPQPCTDSWKFVEPISL